MNVYRLDDKIMDREFLSGKSVFCNAVFTKDDFESGIIKEGDKIVVQLSSGAKYLGKILSFDHAIQDAHVPGKLEIIREQRV